jgi:hypothetical protein
MKKILIIIISISCQDLDLKNGTSISRNRKISYTKDQNQKNKNNLEKINPKNKKESQIDEKVNKENSEKEYEEIYKQKIKELLEKKENEKDPKIKKKIDIEITKLFLSEKLHNNINYLSYIENILGENSEKVLFSYFPLSLLAYLEKDFIEKYAMIKGGENENIIVKHKNVKKKVSLYKIDKNNQVAFFEYKIDITFTFYKEGSLSINASFSEENDLFYLKEEENKIKKYEHQSDFNIEEYIKKDLDTLNKIFLGVATYR